MTESTLPTGTITFLFTDIQGSTPLWEREPEKMAEALQIHNAALRQAIEAHGGVVFKIVGDAFQAAFATAPQALKAAIEGQRALQSAAWNELGPLQVRMGLHTGEAELDPGGDEYAVSHTKNRIGRIHSVASGGQIVLSQETADLVVRKLPKGVTLKDLGEHRLKGMQWLEHLFQVCAPGLKQDFPPLVTAVPQPSFQARSAHLLHRPREGNRPGGHTPRPRGARPPGRPRSRELAEALQVWRKARQAKAASCSSPANRAWARPAWLVS